MLYKEKAQHCPGEVCDVKAKQEIQKTSKTQLLIVFGFIVYLFLAGYFFHDTFRKQPYDLFGINSHAQVK